MSNKPCWYKRDSQAKWECGFFHQWSQSHVEYKNSPGYFPAAIVEDARTQECHVVDAGHVSFSRENPDPKQIIGVKSKRFEPRLVWVEYPRQWLVQVHPETIEVFNGGGKFICQVRWINGKMDYTQGGLPLETLRDMFKKANA